MEIILTKDKID